MRLNAGTRVGPYEILEPLGAGAMGEVFRARDTRLGREVAVKVLPVQFARDAAAVERFRREARAASGLSHPHICPIYDVGEHDGLQYLVMELLDGRTLSDSIASEAIPPTRAIELAIQIADGLDAAHEKGVVHRDLKPANLFVTSRGHVKILDFGVARVAPAAGDEQTVAGLTCAGEAVGTVAYMSPEQARGEPVDARSDLFALGLVLYEMLARQAAFGGPTTAVVFDAILNRQPRPLHELRPDVSPDVLRIVGRLLAKSPAVRYQTAREVIADLRAAVTTASGARAASGSGSVSHQPVSIAVLPFASLSVDPENEYLADGITEEIMNALGQLKGLRVAGRLSSFAFKGRAPDLAEVASKLGVSNVLTGGVRKAGNRLRVTAELVNANDGFQIWSERFDRPADDVFAIQDEIATGIAQKLRVALAAGAEEPRARRGTDNLEAYNLYLKGRHFLQQRGDGIRRGLECFEAAKALDAEFALAHAGLAEAYSLLGFYGVARESDVMPLAKTAALRALDIDSTLDEPHGPLVMVHFLYEWDWAASAAEFDRAMAKNPNAVPALTYRALELACVHGRFDEAFTLSRKVAALDPLSPSSFVVRGTVLFTAGRFADSLRDCQQGCELYPNLWTAMRMEALCHVGLGDVATAISLLERALTISGGHPWIVSQLSDVHRLAGNAEESRRYAEQGLAMRETRYVQPTILGFCAAHLGRLDEAFDWFERACREHDLLPVVNYYGQFLPSPVREDPRWPALMRRIGLEPAPARAWSSAP